MAWDLRGNMDAEVDRVLLSLDHTEDEIASLWPAYPFDEHPPIVSGGGVVDGVFEQNASGNATRNPRRPAYAPGVVAALERVRDRLDAMPELVGKGRGIGSNSWVVDGEHSATGKPILANDPHLGISQPGIWMQMGLHCRARTADCTLDTSGFTFSGVPGVIIGHNADIAWGFTNLGPDVTDLFLEQTEGDDRYVRDGATEAMEVRTETIEVRGEDDVELRVRETVHGPLISDVSTEFATVGANAPTDEPGERGSGYAVALAWTALEPAPTADAILALNRASDWDSFRAAAADFSVPAQNLVYADREGHIGYQSPGRIPIRRAGNDGTMPVEGWISANDWTGDYIPFDGLPSVLDPEEGFIVTANQAVIDERYPYLLTEGLGLRLPLDAHPRGARERGRAVRLGDGRAPARLHQPDGRDARALPPRRRGAAVPLLPQRPEPAARLGLHLAGRQRGRGLLQRRVAHAARARPSTTSCAQRTWPDGGDRWFRVVSQMLSEPAGPWWDDVDTDDAVETRDDILRAVADRRPRRADPPPVPRPAPVGVGAPAPDEPPQRHPRRVRRRAGRAALQPRRLGGRRRLVHRRRHVAGTPSRATRSPPRRRCGWSSRSPTGTTRGGSTSPASPGTRRRRTTPTRPSSTSTARPCPGPSPARPSRRRPRTAGAHARRADVESRISGEFHLSAEVSATAEFTGYPGTRGSATTPRDVSAKPTRTSWGSVGTASPTSSSYSTHGDGGAGGRPGRRARS